MNIQLFQVSGLIGVILDILLGFKKENNIAAVEIHSELLINKYINEFNYDFVNKDIQVINEITVLSYSNKLNLSIIANQINDNGLFF